MNPQSYTIQIARYRFKCPVCGSVTRSGEICLDLDGLHTCLCQMPAKPERRLKPLLNAKANE